MDELALAAQAAQKEFSAAREGSPVSPCPSESEGFSINRALAQVRRWLLGHFTQQNSNSCVVASSRNMIHELTGENIPEEDLQQEVRDLMGKPDHDFETTPINPAYAAQLLEKHGVKTQTHRNIASEDLPATLDGKPALIGFKDPGHRVMLEGVDIDEDGNRTYKVRDPDPAYGGRTREMSQEEFDAKYNPQAIVIVCERAP